MVKFITRLPLGAPSKKGPARTATPLASRPLLLHGDLLVFHSCVLVFIGWQFRDLQGRSVEKTQGGPFGALAKDPPPKKRRGRHHAGAPETRSRLLVHPLRDMVTLRTQASKGEPCALSIRCPSGVHPLPIPFPYCSFPAHPGIQRVEKRRKSCPSCGLCFVHSLSILCPSAVHPLSILVCFLSILPF